ncbi:MAG TPA: hypothetical protein VF930_09205 [Stellaceae bacterium]
MAVPERAPVQVKVRIGEVATAAYAAVFGRLGLALELGWLPLLIMLAVELVPGVVESFSPAPADATAPPFTVEDLVEILATLLCLSAFAVRWYQALLFSSGRARPRHLFAAAWARFIGYTALFSLPTTGPAAALVIFGALSAADDATRMLVGAAAALNIAAALGVLRLSLVWPAAAYGAPMGWREAWRQMRGNTWRLAAVALLVYVPVFVTVGFALSVILTAAHFDIEQLPSRPPLGLVLLGGVVYTVLQFLLMALGAAILAEFYRRLVLHAPADRSRDQ